METNETNRDNIIDLMNENTRLQSLLETANAYGAGENAARIADRELLAQMMILQSLATGHGDTVGDLVSELEPQIERLRAEVAALNQPVKLSEWQELVAERDRLRELVIKASEFCDYSAEESLEYGIRCCCGTKDFTPHKTSCEYGKIAALGGEKKDES